MDYMRGYNDRNRRRRAAHRAASARRHRGRYRRSLEWWKVGIPLAIVILAAVLIYVLFFMGSSRSSSPGGHGMTVASGSGLSAESLSETDGDSEAETAEQSGMADVIASVSAISANAIVKPTPKPRSKAVALTFDDGPSTENTPTVLSVLKKYNAHATFFVVGNRCQAGADLLKQEEELGCEIANHTWDHKSLSSLSLKEVNKEYDRTANLIKKLTGYQVKLLRPPYGAISDVMRQKLKHPMIYWSIDTLDWKSLNAKKVFKEIKKNVSDGDIILMHDIHASTAEAVKKIVPWLLDNDYDLLTVSELMERGGIKMKNGKVYMNAK